MQVTTSCPSVKLIVKAPRIVKATVLLVEDDGACRNALRRELGRAGYDVCEAANGLEALFLVHHRHIDAIVTDIIMPSMGGLSLTSLVRKDAPSMPIVAMTGVTSVGPAGARLLEDSHVELLNKPFQPDELMAALLRAIAA